MKRHFTATEALEAALMHDEDSFFELDLFTIYNTHDSFTILSWVQYAPRYQDTSHRGLKL